MAEYWKSTPKYWCKHCSVYVRDTKLERQNHDATAKHQGAVKRALRDLHRGHEKEERDKDRAKREIERLNGVVGPASSTPSSSTQPSGTADATRSRPAPAGASHPAPGALPEVERKRQAEQLASLGVSLPDEFRRDLAMVGDWQVTTTTIVQEKPADANPGATARGIHKRERTEEQLEVEDAVKGLFKKPRRWGRDSRTIDGQDDSLDLDALLSGGLAVKKIEEEEEPKREEEGEDEEEKQQSLDLPPIKKEPLDGTDLSPGAPGETSVPTTAGDGGGDSVVDSVADTAPKTIKTEHQDGSPGPAGTEGSSAPVVFKKRKPKNIRQK